MGQDKYSYVTPTAIATNPHPVNSPNMHTRPVCKDPGPKYKKIYIYIDKYLYKIIEVAKNQ